MTSDLQGPPRQGPPTPGTGGVPDPEAYLRAQTSPQFIELRSRYRGFAFPMTAAFLVWYFMFVFAAVFAPEWMATPVFGNINIGIIFGLLQFVVDRADHLPVRPPCQQPPRPAGDRDP